MNKRQERALEVFLYVTFAIALVVGVGTTKSDTNFLSPSIESMVGDGDPVIGYGQTLTNFDSYEDMQLQSMISFAANDDKINALGRRELFKHANVLRNNPHLILNITGHSENNESTSYNYMLSEKRAMRVYEMLVLYGTPRDQLIVDSSIESALEEKRCVELQYLTTVSVQY
ncbi:OmpA family protein [Kaarinaea lacus]